jgi:hypothetical protein
MATLLIREIPDALDNYLKRSAERNHRSKEKQALHLLETAAGGGEVDWSDFIDQPKRTAKRPAELDRSNER